ncbi:MAG: hypothetical protein ACUVRK_01090 [Spirochaetota bacterium]
MMDSISSTSFSINAKNDLYALPLHYTLLSLPYRVFNHKEDEE